VEEALKEKALPHGVHGGEVQEVGQEAPHGASPGHGQDAPAPGEAGHLPGQEEEAGKPQGLHGAELLLKPPGVIGPPGVAGLEGRPGQPAQVVHGALPGGQGDGGVQEALGEEGEGGGLRQGPGVGPGLGEG
jgi:hypothetical protein